VRVRSFGPRMRWRTASGWSSAATPCAGSTRPRVPLARECRLLFEESSRTLLRGDLFTQPGASHPPVTSGDILGRARRCEGRSTTVRTRRARGRCWSDWLRFSPPRRVHARVCGTGIGRGGFASWRIGSRWGSRRPRGDDSGAGRQLVVISRKSSSQLPRPSARRPT
jgi:hypothetical protein